MLCRRVQMELVYNNFLDDKLHQNAIISSGVLLTSIVIQCLHTFYKSIDQMMVQQLLRDFACLANALLWKDKS